MLVRFWGFMRVFGGLVVIARAVASSALGLRVEFSHDGAFDAGAVMGAGVFDLVDYGCCT